MVVTAEVAGLPERRRALLELSWEPVPLLVAVDRRETQEIGLMAELDLVRSQEVLGVAVKEAPVGRKTTALGLRELLLCPHPNSQGEQTMPTSSTTLPNSREESTQIGRLVEKELGNPLPTSKHGGGRRRIESTRLPGSASRV